MYNEEEPYYEPTIADEILIAYQQKMKDALLDTVKDMIENLKKENENLKKQNEGLRKNERDVRTKEYELENKIKELDRNFYRNKFSDLLKDVIVKGYGVERKYITQDKCDLCDEDRKIEYVSKYGDVTKLKCKCAEGKYIHIPIEVNLFQIEVCKNFNYNESVVWTEVKFADKDWDDRSITLKPRDIVDVFDENQDKSYWNALYLNKEECQKHCDYLNNKN